MTSVLPETRACAHCGRRAVYGILASTNTWGSPDLDLRPPEMQRSTMDSWIQSCPQCGYCAPDVRELVEGAPEVIASRAYAEALDDAGMPRLARRFVCWSMLAVHGARHDAAVLALLHAAWVCDDAQAQAQALDLRCRAIAMLASERQSGRTLFRRPGLSELLLTDMLRRCGRSSEARDWAIRGLAAAVDATYHRIFAYQLQLVERGDTQRHTVSEAPRWEPSTPARR